MYTLIGEYTFSLTGVRNQTPEGLISATLAKSKPLKMKSARVPGTKLPKAPRNPLGGCEGQSPPLNYANKIETAK